MVDVNVNALADQAPTMAPPTRTDDQILPHIRWVPIGKINCYLDVERSQSNLIFKIAVDISRNTNFFRAFTASSTIPSIYIQQFWDTVQYDKIAGCYMCQLDEQWLDLTKDTIRDALLITPVDNSNAFSSPPTLNALINFVNDLSYPKVVRNLSDFVTNDMFQPWRALTTIINLCLTGKTSGFERPRAPVKHKFHSRPDSILHLPNEEPVLGYLKFSAKETKREVFGMPIANDLITDDIRGSVPNSPVPKPAIDTKKSKPSSHKATPFTKPATAKASKSTSSQQPKHAPAKTGEKKHEFIDEEGDMQRAVEESLKSVHDAPRGPLLPVVIREPDSRKFQPLPEVQGKGKEKVSDEQAALALLTLQTPKKKSPADQFIFQRHTSTLTESSGHDESSSLYVELGLTDTEMESDEEVPRIDAGNLKLTVKEQVILEEPASSIGTLSSQQQLAKDFSFGDLFFNDKPSEAENEKTIIETEVKSMVSVVTPPNWVAAEYRTGACYFIDQ
nr:hypothetical protein [Tanacetum cinerariifolium]